MERGVLRYYELANKSTVVAIQTEDIGYEIGGEFETVEHEMDIAGCALAIGEFIEANK